MENKTEQKAEMPKEAQVPEKTQDTKAAEQPQQKTKPTHVPAKPKQEGAMQEQKTAQAKPVKSGRLMTLW